MCGLQFLWRSQLSHVQWFAALGLARLGQFSAGQSPRDDPTTAGRYLVDADELGAVYRDAFLTGLERLHEAGKLKLEGDFARLQSDEAWQDFTGALESTDWVSHIEPPPQAHGSAEHVLK